MGAQGATKDAYERTKAGVAWNEDMMGRRCRARLLAIKDVAGLSNGLLGQLTGNPASG